MLQVWVYLSTGVPTSKVQHAVYSLVNRHLSLGPICPMMILYPCPLAEGGPAWQLL